MYKNYNITLHSGSITTKWKSIRYRAKFTLALCPPLRETPRSPTRVMSPSANKSISYDLNNMRSVKDYRKNGLQSNN